MALGQSTQDYLNLISQYESANQNIPNYKFGPGFTAQGYYQITNENWNNIAPLLGIDTTQYPSAMAAPQSVQAQVAAYLLTQTPAGIGNWSANPQLMAALQSAGMQTYGPIGGGNGSVSGALTDLFGDGASMSTSDILSGLESSASSIGIDLTNPATDIVIALALGALAYMAIGALE